MIDRDKWMTSVQYTWPENYYRETDSVKRQEMLKDRMAETTSAEEKVEDQLRRKLWEARYLDRKGKQDGTDNYLKLWTMLPMAAGQKGSFFGRKTVRTFVEQVRETFQTELQKENPEYENLWYDEYMNFFDFYITICKTDKSYTNVLFHLAKISEDQLIVKIAEDLREKTVDLPESLGLSREFALLPWRRKTVFSGIFRKKNRSMSAPGKTFIKSRKRCKRRDRIRIIIKSRRK